MHTRPVVLGAALVVTAAAMTRPAHAQADGATTDDRKKQAGKDFADGDRAFKAGDFRGAAEAYERAYKRLPHHSALWNAARSWHRAGDLPRAANLYARYLDEAPASARDRNNAQKALTELAARLGHLQIHAAGLAGVKVDGDPVSTSEVYVTPGAHVVEGQASDGHTARQSQNVEPGDTVSVALVAPGGDAPAPTPTAAAPPSAVPPSSRTWSPIVVYFGGAVTLALAGVTVWSGVDTLGQKDTFDKNPTRQNLDTGLQSQTRTNSLIAATAAVGILTGVAAVFLVDWHGGHASGATDGAAPPKDATSRALRWGVGPGSVVLQGEF